MRLIDAERLAKVVEGWKKPKVYSEADERQNAIIECILYNIKCAPPIPLPDFKDGYKQAIIDGKTNFAENASKEEIEDFKQEFENLLEKAQGWKELHETYDEKGGAE